MRADLEVILRGGVLYIKDFQYDGDPTFVLEEVTGDYREWQDDPLVPLVTEGWRDTYHAFLRGDEKGRLYWPDWQRCGSGGLQRMAPPRTQAELQDMLADERPWVRERAIELIPEMPAEG